ncbi:MAG: PEP-CTERM sorting domain-containing protein [Colwellia sp.]|nr:PEP-CTERM sorting domain-containing protein [Colwellia sp.]
MKFITKIGAACTTIAMMASTISYAGTVTTGQLGDHYIGAYAETTSTSDYMPTNNPNYNTHYMQVSRITNGNQGSLSVTVNSNFVGYDSIYKLGDLFLMDGANYNTAASCLGGTARGCSENSYTPGTNKWEYAFDLGLDLNDSTKNSTSNYNNEAGQLRKIDTDGDITSSSSAYHQSVNTASQLIGGRGWQIVDAKSSNSAVGSGGTWGTDVASKLLTMTFDISGTSLMDSEQIALRWAMSCANDIIEVVADLTTPGGSTAVPEPSTFLLMLLAGFGFFASRQKKDMKFKA